MLSGGTPPSAGPSGDSSPCSPSTVLALAIFAGIAQGCNGYDPLLLGRNAENDDAGRAAPGNPDVVYRATDDLALIGDEHDLVAMLEPEDGDDGVAALAQIHVVDALPAAPP